MQSSQDFIKEIRNIENKVLSYIENEANNADLTSIINIMDDFKIRENKNKLNEVLNLISNISLNHHRTPDFFAKIESLINIFKKEIKDYFSNFSIFHIFKNDKRILYFLFSENILKPDQTICQIITRFSFKQKFYPQFFYPEFKDFYDAELLKEISKDYNFMEIDLEIFNQNRKIGENHQYLCKLIREDSIQEFVSYVNQRSMPLSSTEIEYSIFETNPFLLKKTPKLCEYAAFFGSIQIFKYLQLNINHLYPLMWSYSIYSNNAELFYILENGNINPPFSYNYVLSKSIKCFHNSIANYINDNLLDGNLNSNSYLKYHNYEFIHLDLNDEKLLSNLCAFGYPNLVDILLKTTGIDINKTLI